MLELNPPGTPRPPSSVEGLLERARRGEAPARRELVEATLSTVYRRALRLSARVDLAKAWVKATYLSAFETLSQGSLETRGGLEVAFTRVLLQQAHEALRDEFSPPVQEGSPNTEGATLPALESMLGELTPVQRFALVLRELESVPAEDARALLGFLGEDVDEALSAALGTLERRAGPAGVSARLDAFRVSTATPPRPAVEDMVPGDLELPPTTPGTSLPGESSPGMPQGGELGEDEISAAFERALTEPPRRTPSSPGVARPLLPQDDFPAEPEVAAAWYLGVDEKQVGPLSKQGVRKLWASGGVGPDTLAWREGLPDWLAISRIVDFMDLTATPSGPPSEPPPRTSSARTLPEFALSALVQQELSAITATAVTELPKKNTFSATPRRTRSLLELPAVDDHPEPPPAFDPETQPHLEVRRSADEDRRPTAPGILPLSVAPPPQARPPPFLHGRLPVGWARSLILGLALANVLLVGWVATRSLHRRAQRTATPTAVSPAPAVAQTPLSPVILQAAPPVAEAVPLTPPPAEVAPPASAPKSALPHPKVASSSAPRPAAKPAVAAAPAPGATVGNAAQNDRDFNRMFSVPKNAPPAPLPPPRRAVYVPPPTGKGPSLERLSASDVMGVVLAHRKAIEVCAVEQGHQRPNEHGTLVMRFSILPNGRVGSVAPATEALKKTYLARCLGREIPRWRFSKHLKAGDPIAFPFKF